MNFRKMSEKKDLKKIRYIYRDFKLKNVTRTKSRFNEY